MRFLLDTNAFLRSLDGTLPAKVERRLLKPGAELLLSVVTPWEIALKPALSTRLPESLIAAKVEEMSLRVLSVTFEHVAAFRRLPPRHADPFDRILIAQAIEEGCALVSSDQRFPLYADAGLSLLWD